MPANYNHIARVYDLLSRLVFGRQIMKAQISLLKFIPINSRILIVGGGTGWILHEISTLFTGGLSIDYVEVSEKMIELSKQRNIGANKVRFIHQAIEEFVNLEVYDVIITPFIFDNFTKKKIGSIFSKLLPMLKPKGLWLHADFVYDKSESPFWQKILLKVMYFFFRITCRIETTELVDLGPYFAQDFQKIFEGSFYFGFIKARAYKKHE